MDMIVERVGPRFSFLLIANEQLNGFSGYIRIRPPSLLPPPFHEHDPFKSEIMWTVAGLIQASQTHSDEK